MTKILLTFFLVFLLGNSLYAKQWIMLASQDMANGNDPHAYAIFYKENSAKKQLDKLSIGFGPEIYPSLIFGDGILQDNSGKKYNNFFFAEIQDVQINGINELIYKYNHHNYGLATTNCTDFIKDIAIVMGLKAPNYWNSVWPNHMIQELKSLNNDVHFEALKSFSNPKIPKNENVVPFSNWKSFWSSKTITNNSLSAGAALLFKGVKSKLSDKQKNQIFQKTGFTLNKAKNGFVEGQENLGINEASFTVNVDAIDINNDGEQELFVHWGNLFTSGNVGKSVTLFINTHNEYKPNLGFGGYAFLTSDFNNGFPNILIGGPGFVSPIWSWNGSEYVFWKQLNQNSGEYKKLKLIPLPSIAAEVE